MSKSLKRANDDWQELKNPFYWFLIVSYAKTNIFSKDHISKLRKGHRGNTIIQDLLTRIEPFYDEFAKLYDAWHFASRRYAGYTRAVNDLLNELQGSKIRRWDILIQVVYDIDTREYYELLPYNRKPFQNGSIDGRILATKQLANNLTAFPNLADVQVKVDTFYQQIEEVRDKQQQYEQEVRNSSNVLKVAQENLIDELFYNLSILRAVHYKKTSDVTGFFQMDIISNSTANKGEVEEEFQENIEPLMPDEVAQTDDNATENEAETDV